MKKIAILGCGWLGLPLAISFLKNGFEVNGATTTHSKLSELSHLGIHPFLISIENDSIEGDIEVFFKNVSVLIITIPPKLRTETNENFLKKMAILVPFIEKCGVKKVIFVSSTSVFEDANQVVCSAEFANPNTNSGIQLLECEKLLQENSNFDTTIVRFGGLIGKDRHPIYSLSGKKGVKNPNAAINLIHLSDCIAVLQRVIALQYWRKTLHAVAPFDAAKADFYTKKALKMGLNPPIFDFLTPSFGKKVLPFPQEFFDDFEFEYPNLE